MQYHGFVYLVIQRNHEVTIIGSTVGLVFQSPMFRVQFNLQSKQNHRNENIVALAKHEITHHIALQKQGISASTPEMEEHLLI